MDVFYFSSKIIMQWFIELKGRKIKITPSLKLREGTKDLPGQSVRGSVLAITTLSKVPAQASLFVRKGEDKLKSFFTVAGMDECSNSDEGDGPLGP